MAAERRLPGDIGEDDGFADVSTLVGGGYARLFERWAPTDARVPTLLLGGGPTPEMLEADPARDWRPAWPFPHRAVTVPGDHDTVLTDHADTTAAALTRWIESLVAGTATVAG